MENGECKMTVAGGARVGSRLPSGDLVRGSLLQGGSTLCRHELLTKWRLSYASAAAQVIRQVGSDVLNMRVIRLLNRIPVLFLA